MEKSISSKYKRRLTIIIVIIILSAILGAIAGKVIYDSLYPTYVALEESIETLEVTSDEDYYEILKKNHPELISDENITDRETTLQALKIVKTAAENNIFSYGLGGLCASFYLALSGIAIGTMMIVIIVRKVMYRIWKDLKVWITVVIPIIFIALLLIISPVLYLLFTGYLGMFAQLPLLIYTFVKYRKAKKEEDKDDIIVKEDDDVNEETKEENDND